ncbi:MAG: cysteine--tRNA ligase [bacterium]|nr:cysteine--tRNA ligase [bacterium]
MKFYNTLSRQLEEFKPIKDKEVGIYSCGPTVYWNQHIGNMYAFTQWDLLVRTLRFMGYKVTWVMNITDVGHLTSDADTGEDKMEKGAVREGLTVWQIADKYITQFKESMNLLNIQTPDVLPRATEHIQEQVDLIKKMEEREFTYKTKTGLVFDTSKFPQYADFARLNLKEMEAGARVEVDPEKKQPWDFLLWVTNQPTHLMQWDSPWGKGFPGWHIECTAMSTKYLGETFDIHTGGKEHIPVHHTNEIAQAFGAFGRQTANYWLHNEWLNVKEGKLSKSGGETILVTDIMAKGFEPMHLRYLFLTSQYRTGIAFSWGSLEGAKSAYERLVGLLSNWKGEKERTALSEEKMAKIAQFRNRFIEALSSDLNIPGALGVVWETVKSNIPDTDKYDLILSFDEVLGLRLVDAIEKRSSVTVPSDVSDLLQQREKARAEKNFSEADRFRKLIEEKGWVVEDKPGGAIVRKAVN